MVGIDLTVKGSNASNLRMVTEQTLDREGFFIPEPPQRVHHIRAKSALGTREQRCQPPHMIHKSPSRPKSAAYPSKKEYESCRPNSSTTIHHNNEIKHQLINQGDFKGLISSAKMTMNQKWIQQAERPKWKPRNSQVAETRPIKKLDKHDVKQQISVCEVMAKMRSNSSESSGAAAPPSSPKSSTSIVVGKRFVEDYPMSNEQPSYINYAKSRTNLHVKSRNTRALSYLQEDMTITNEPSSKQNRDIIEIPTMDMFSTDEPDEESVVIIDQRNVPPEVSQSSLYDRVYLKDYNESKYNPRGSDASRIDRPKSDRNYVRYTPDTYRFKNSTRFTKERVFHRLWDREQLRPPVGNVKAVSACRPSHSIYTGVS